MSGNKKKVIISISIFTCIGFAVIIIFIILSGQINIFSGRGYNLYVEYAFLDNLTVGSKVKILGGPNIGQVEEIFFDQGHIIVRLFIKEQFKLNRDAIFRIYATSLVGQKYVNVSHYNPSSTDLLEPDAHIVGENPMGYSRLLEIAGDALTSVLPGSADETITKVRNTFITTSDLISALNVLVQDNQEEVQNTISQLTITLRELGNLARSINTLIDENHEKLSEGLGNLGKMTAPLERAVSQVDVLLNAVDGKKINTMMVQLTSSMNEIARLLADKDSLLVWLNSAEVRFELSSTLRNLYLFSKKIKDDPSIIMWRQ
ncbi:MAG: MCE family protein [Spirochaetales bacterium]|nr:MCE family protein [Spirochaetales bacterium]